MLEQHPIWDQNDLLGRMRGKSERVVKLVNLFLSDMPSRMDSLNNTASELQLQACANTAHTVKGVAANLSVARLSHVAADLEVAAKSNRPDEVTQLLAKVNEVYEESENQLKAFVAANT